MRADFLSKSFMLALPVYGQAHAVEPLRPSDSAVADALNWIDAQ